MIKQSFICRLFGLFLIFCVPLAFAQEEKKEILSIIGVGDIMLGTNYPSKQHLPPNNGVGLMKSVNHILQAADVTFGNLEGTVLDAGGNAKKCGKCYAFRMPEKLMGNLETAGFDVVSLANNHSGDFGAAGRKNTLNVLSNLRYGLGIQAAGLVSKPTASFERGGARIGFTAFAPNSGTLDIRNIAKAQQIVRELAQTHDIVIVSFHGGAEGSKHQHVTRKTEYYYGENRGNVHAFSHAVIDAGADIVFGHGPHVTRAVEVYKKRFIAYSLGNFCTYDRFNLRGPGGIAPIIDVRVDRQGEFKNAKVTATMQIGEGIVKIDPKKRAIRSLQQLTKADFPNSTITISDSGLIHYKQ